MRIGWTWMLAAMLAAPMIGCGAKDKDTDTPGDPIAANGEDHGHAKDLPGALKELKEYNQTISDGFKEDDEEKAHAPLHEVGHVLEGMVDHMDDMTEGLSEENKATVEASTKKLFDLFMKVDAKLHGQDGVDYSEVSDEIDAEIAALTAVVESSDTPAEPTGEPAADPTAEPAKEPADEKPAVTEEPVKPREEPAKEPAKEPAGDS